MNNELAHYGVLGMKWGVHRAKTTSSSNKKQSKSVNDETATKRKSTAKSKIKMGWKQLGQLKLGDPEVIHYNMAGRNIVNAMFATDPDERYRYLINARYHYRVANYYSNQQ